MGGVGHGDEVAKHAIFPDTEDHKALVPVLIHGDELGNILSSNLRAYHKVKTAKFSFCVQLYCRTSMIRVSRRTFGTAPRRCSLLAVQRKAEGPCMLGHGLKDCKKPKSISDVPVGITAPA